MSRQIRRILLCAVIASAACLGGMLADSNILNEQHIRMQIFSDTVSEDSHHLVQVVHDAVMESLRSDLQGIGDFKQAWQYLQISLERIEDIADQTLKAYGLDCNVKAELNKVFRSNWFWVPSFLTEGTYGVLRITIDD